MLKYQLYRRKPKILGIVFIEKCFQLLTDQCWQILHSFTTKSNILPVIIISGKLPSLPTNFFLFLPVILLSTTFSLLFNTLFFVFCNILYYFWLFLYDSLSIFPNLNQEMLVPPFFRFNVLGMSKLIKLRKNKLFSKNFNSQCSNDLIVFAMV